MNCLVFDLETTGLTDPIDILQFSYLLVSLDSGTIFGAGNEYFLPSRCNINPDAYKVNGLSKEFLHSKTTLTFDRYFRSMYNILDSVDAIMGYNSKRFDLPCILKYKDKTLNNALESKEHIDVMADYSNILYKVYCDKNRGGWKKANLTLSECLYLLISKGFDLEQMIKKYKQVFGIQDDKVHFHDASFDTFITYMVYVYAKGVK